MKCNRCGNEFFAGTVCPNCGNSVPMENASETVAYNEEISVNVDEGADKNLSEPAVNVYSHGTPQPQEGIFANSGMASQGMYGGQPMSSQNIYSGQPMSNRNMYGSSQPMSGQPVQSQGMYGGQPMSAQMYNGGQPMSSQMYNNSQSVSGPGMYGYANTNATMNEPQKKSKLPIIIAGITLVAAVIAIILILVLVVFKKDDDGNDDNNIVTTEEGNNGHTNEPSTDTTEPSTDTAEPSTDTTEPSTDAPSTEDNKTGSTLSGEILFSNETVEISCDKTYINDIGEFVIEGKMTNKSDVKIGMGLDACSVNNVSLDAYLYGSADTNATGDWQFVVDASGLAVSDLTKITDVEMYFSIYDGETYMDIFVDEMKATCDVEVTTKKVVGKDNWKTVYSNEYCDIAALDCVFDDDYLRGYKTYIRVTNKTEELSTIMADDSKLDGAEVDIRGGYLCVAPKATAYMVVYWNKEDVPDSAKKFGEINMEIEMYDSTNYTSMTDTDITFKTNGVVE